MIGRGLRAWAPFLAVGLAAHGLLLVDDGVYLDDWWLLRLMRQGRFGDLHTIATTTGYPLTAWFEWAFLAFPDPVLGWKLYTFAILVVSAGLVARICHAASLATPRQALAIGLLSLAAPAHRALGFFSGTGQYIGYLAVFLAATLLVLRAEPLVGPPRRWRRALALLLFWVSFYLNSLLVPYVGLCLLVLAQRWRRSGFGGLRPWITQHWAFLLMPWIFWGLKLLRIYGTRGELHTYNRILWDPTAPLLVYEEAFRTYALMARAWLRPGALLLLAGAVLVVALARRAFPPEPAARRAGLRLVLLGLALFFFGLAPYAAVGKGIGPPGAHWSGHYGILLGPPLGLLAVGLLVLTFGSLTRGACAVAGVVLVMGIADNVAIHVHWHADAVKWKAVCQQVARSSIVRQANVVAVVDKWPRSMHNTVEGGDIGRAVLQGRLMPWVRLASGFTPFFGYFCAPGAPKVAMEIRAPDLAQITLAPAALKAAKGALVQATRAGLLPRDALDTAMRALDAAYQAGPDALHAEILRHWPAITVGLEQTELLHPGLRGLRDRTHLSLAGLPPTHAVSTGLWKFEVEAWEFESMVGSVRLPDRHRSALVLVRPGQGYAPVAAREVAELTAGRSREAWEQTGRLWLSYQQARFFGGPDAVTRLLDRVANVDVRPLAQ